MLSQYPKKNKQPMFRQFAPPVYRFAPAEDCPRTKNGMINRSYKNKCAKEIEKQEIEINRMGKNDDTYAAKKTLYIAKLLTDLKSKTITAATNDIEERGQLIYAQDTIIETKRLKEFTDGILNNDTPTKMKEYFDAINMQDFNEIQRYILITTYYKKAKMFCDDGGKCADGGKIYNHTYPKGTEIQTQATDIKEKIVGSFQDDDNAFFEDIDFNPLVAAFMLDGFYSTGITNYNIPFGYGEDNYDSDEDYDVEKNPHTEPYCIFYEKFSKVQEDKWYNEEAEAVGNSQLAKTAKEYVRIVPVNPFMFYMFITDEENRKVLSPQIGSIVDLMKTKYINTKLQDWEKETRQGNKLVNGGRLEMDDMYYPDENEDNTVDASLKPDAYDTKSKAGLVPKDLSQGIVFSDSGKKSFIVLLGMAIVRAAHLLEFQTLKIDTSKPLEEWFLEAYSWLCFTQENHFKTYKEWIPYSMSEFGAAGGIFPDILYHELQSLEHLNVRVEGNRPICSACEKGYETYYGASRLGINKRRPGLNKGDIVDLVVPDLPLDDSTTQPRRTQEEKWIKSHRKKTENLRQFIKDGFHKCEIVEFRGSKVNIKIIGAGTGRFERLTGVKVISRDYLVKDIPVSFLVVKHANSTGICTKMLDGLLDAFETNAEKNNPWYVRWVGTYTQAARRLENYKRKQTEMYDNNDPNYSFISYYTQLIVLQMDYWIKKIFNICDVKVDESGDELRPLSDKDAKEFGGILEEINDKWKEMSLGAVVGALSGAAAATVLTGGGAVIIAGAAAAAGAAGALLGYGGTKLIGKIYTVIKAGGMLLYKLILVILKMPFIQEILLEFVTDAKNSMCRKLAITENRVVMRKGELGNTKEFNETTGKWMDLTEKEKLQQGKAMAAAKSKKMWGTINKVQAAVSGLTGAEGGGMAKKATDGMSMQGPDSPIKKVFDFIGQVPGVSHLLKALGIAPENLCTLMTAALMTTANKTWNSMVSVNTGVGRIMRLYDAITGDGGCLDSSGNLVLTDGGTASQGSQYCAYAFEQITHNIPYYAMLVLNAMYKEKYEMTHHLKMNKDNSAAKLDNDKKPIPIVNYDGTPKITRAVGEGAIIKKKCEPVVGGTINPNWEVQYQVQVENLIQGQVIPCGKDAHLKMDDVQWRSNKKLLTKYYEGQLKQYESYKNKQYFKKTDFEMDVVKFSPFTKREKKAVEALKEEAGSSWGYWLAGGLVLAAAVGVAVVVAGGPMAVAALAKGAATVVGKKIMDQKDVLVEKSKELYKHSGKILNKTIGYAKQASDSYLGQAIKGGLKKGLGAIKEKLKDEATKAMKHMAENPSAALALMYLGGEIMMGGLTAAKEMMKHWGDKYKCLPMSKVFAEQPEWDAIFRKKLALKVSEFVGIMGNDATVAIQHNHNMFSGTIEDLKFEHVIQIKKSLMQCVGLVADFNDDMFWWFIDLEGTANFFEQYAAPECFMPPITDEEIEAEPAPKMEDIEQKSSSTSSTSSPF